MLKQLTKTALSLLYPNGATRSVQRGYARGIQFKVVQEMAFRYAWCPKSFRFDLWRMWFRKGDTFLDIGANHGHISLPSSRWVGETGKVYSFEPVPSIYKVLSQNVELNSFSNITVVPVGVGEKTESTQFMFSESYSSQGHLATVDNVAMPEVESQMKAIDVEIMSLDDWMGEHPNVKPDVIKIDVEGAALYLFKGAKDTLKKFQPTIFIDIHNNDEVKAIEDNLGPLGYEFCMLWNTPVENIQRQWPNPLLCVPPGENRYDTFADSE